MKILRLRFTNLNSLRDAWSIDFTAAPLADAGLFAITGPTGAGKTTLLDAITLALYGRAARYGNDANPEEMMSRHTGFCSAEVEFSCANGVYRSVWQLKRARNQATGKVQNPERRVISLPDEVVLTQKIDESNRKIEELTNLNYERFLRSVMLAQGDFAAFLKAKPNERTELLEQITGTGIYSEISKAAYRYASDAQASLEALRTRHAAVPVLTPEARAERETQLTARAARLAEIKSESAAVTSRVADARAFLASAEEAAGIESEAAQIGHERKAAGPDLEALELHEKVRPFIAQLTAVDLLAKLQGEDAAKLETLRRALPGLEEQVAADKKLTEENRRNLESAQREEETLTPLWAQVSQLDADLAFQRHVLAQRKAGRQLAEEALQTLRSGLAEKRGQQKAHQTALAELANWLQANPGEAGIAAALPDLRAAYAQWAGHHGQREQVAAEAESLRQNIQNSEKTLAAVQAAVAKLKTEWDAKEAAAKAVRSEMEQIAGQRTIAQWEQERDAAQARVNVWQELQTLATEIAEETARQTEGQAASQAQAAREAELAREVDRQRERIEAASELTAAQRKNVDLIRLVQTLEQHRHELVEGRPCPLCGALEHPYASPDQAPSSELSRAITDLSRAESQQETLQKERAELEKLRASNEARHRQQIAELKAIADRLAHREKQWSAKIQTLGMALNAAQKEERETLLAGENQRHRELRDRVTALRAVDERQRAVEQAANKAKELLGEKSAEFAKLGGLLQQTTENLQKTSAKTQGAAQATDEARAAFARLVSAFGWETPDLRSADAAFAELKTRSDNDAAKRQQKVRIELDVAALGAGLAELEKRLAGDAEKFAALKTEEQAAEQALAASLRGRAEKFGDKVVAADQERVAASIKENRARSEAAADRLNKALQREASARKELGAIGQAMQEHGKQLAEKTDALSHAAQEVGFADVERLRQAELPKEREQEISAVRKSLHNREQALVGRRAAHQAAQAKVPAAARDDAPRIAELITQQQNLEAERGTLDQQRGALQEQLNQDAQHRKDQQAISGQFEAADREQQRWSRLSALIGSGGGAVFARFAQGLTLERLVAVANRHLAQLSPRYAMRRANGAIDDLELEIIDRYQADATRPMRSLSGGESFLASLALAVGLSELASGRTAIESLFIDEGFGSLDPATLEIAMAALEGLRTNGKTIGVISHVDAMKERISTQIRVEKRDGGRSILEVTS